MNRILLFTAGLLLAPAILLADTQSRYAGQELREIKALSSDDIRAYLDGNGMGFAKAAELNHYPGPRHVLDLADRLSLSEEQREQTQALYSDMKQHAMSLGRKLVEKERALNDLFSNDTVTSENLDAVLKDLGEIRAKIRYVHLHAHLKQKQILSRHQVMQYDKFRGYGDGGHVHDHKH